MRTHTKTLAAALDILAREIQSGDGIANAAIAEAAARLRELDTALCRATVYGIESDGYDSRIAHELRAWVVARGCEPLPKLPGYCVEAKP